jgi:hypothetical protein
MRIAISDLYTLYSLVDGDHGQPHLKTVSANLGPGTQGCQSTVECPTLPNFPESVFVSLGTNRRHTALAAAEQALIALNNAGYPRPPP